MLSGSDAVSAPDPTAIADYLRALRELGAATAQVERELGAAAAGLDLTGAYLEGYRAELERLQAHAAQLPGHCGRCGAMLDNVAGQLVCGACTRPQDLTEQLAELGRNAAREAWTEHAGVVERIPTAPELRPLAHVAYLRDLLETDRPFDNAERRTVIHAYRNELHVTMARACPEARR